MNFHLLRGTKNYTLFSANIKTRECIITFKDILPDWLSNSDEFLFDAILSHGEYMKQDDCSLFMFIYNTLINCEYLKYINQDFIEFQIRLKDTTETTFSLYKFTVYPKDEEHLFGIIYREPDLQLSRFDREALSNKIVNFKEFRAYVNTMLLKYGDVAIVQCDINGFGSINSLYGEVAGDGVLHHIESTLIYYLSSDGKVVYRQNDVFTIVVKYYVREALTEFIQILNRACSTYGNLNYSMAWGVYLADNTQSTVRNMMDCASMARKEAKKSIVNNIAYFDVEKQNELNMKKFVESNMFTALTNNEFKVLIQPKCSVTSNELVGGEALSRWQMVDGSVVLPDIFIPLFEENGFIVKLDYFIWGEVCKLLRKWMDVGLKPVPISVNVSRYHLKSADFIDYLDKLTDTYKIDHKYLPLEITESDTTEVYADIMHKCKSRGYILQMDDFGVKYSTLATLGHTDFNVIKLDKDFISGLFDSYRGQQIVARVIEMLKDADFEVVAEGVETNEQFDFLELHGCDIAQGYLYSKPLTVGEFEELLVKQNKAVG